MENLNQSTNASIMETKIFNDIYICYKKRISAGSFGVVCPGTPHYNIKSQVLSKVRTSKSQ